MPNEEDRKWLYGQFKDNGYDTGSYDDFVKSLDNDEDFEWWHNEATSLGLEVGDLAEFGSLFRTPKQETAAPAVEGEVPTNFDDQPDMRALNDRAQRRAKANEGYEMFDAMRNKKLGTPIANAPQEVKNELDRAEKQRKADVQRFGTGKDAYSAEEAANIGKLYESVASESASLNKDIEQYNKTGRGDYASLTTRERELRRNTEELRKSPAWKEYLDLTDRYETLKEATETPEIRLEKARLAAELSRNPIARVGMGENAPSESQINFDTNRAEVDYIESQMENADRAQKKEYKARLKELNHEVLDNEYYQADVARRIGENQAEQEDVYARMNEIRQRVLKEKSKMETLDDALLAEPEYQKLKLAATQLEQTGRKLAHIRDKNAGDFWVNFMDVFADPNTYTFNITNLETALMTKAATMNPDADGSRDLIDAVIGANETNAEEGKFVEGKGKYGQIAAQSIPFMFQIGLTGGFGNVANAVSGKVTRALGDSFMTRMTGAVLGDLSAGFVAANTIGGGKTLSDIVNNYYGTLVSDGKGGFKYEGGQDLGRAVWGAEVGNTLEYASERAGDHMQHLLGRSILGWGIKSAQRNGKGAVNLAVEELAKTMDVTLKDFGFRSANQAGANWAQKAMGTMFQALNKMGVQGLPFEVTEEYVGLLGNIILGGEEKWMDFSKLGDKETHTDIWGGMLYSIGLTQAGAVAMGGVGAGVAGIRKAQAYHQLENALESNANVAATLLGEDNWKSIKNTIDGTTNKDLPAKVVEYMDSNELDPQQKAAILDYVKNTYLFRGFNAGTIAQARERLMSEDNLASLNINAEAASAQDQIADAYMLGYQQSTAKRADIEQADLDKESRRSAMDAVEQREEIAKAVERQKARMAELTGIADMTEADASRLLNDNTNSTDPHDIEVRDAALDYLMALAVERGFEDAENNRQLRGKALIEAELKRKIGNFFYETPIGDRVVETSQWVNPATNRPENIFLLSSEPDNEGKVPFVSVTGRRGFVSREQIADFDNAGNTVQGLTKTQSLNDFLDAQYAYEQTQREIGLAQQDAVQTEQRQAAEGQQGQQNFRQMAESMEGEDGSFTYNGVKGSLVRKTDQGAIFAPDDESPNMELTWEQLAQTQSAAPAPAPAPTQAPPAPTEAPAAEAPVAEAPKIPRDEKTGEKIYDAPGVSVVDALEDLYGTKGLSEAQVDDYIREMSADAEKGRNPKRGKMSPEKWGEATAEANRKADFWKQMKEVADANTAARKEDEKKEAERQALIDKYGVDTSNFDLTPQSLEEAVAAYLGGDSVGLINLDDAIRETLGKRKDNRVPTELFKHLGQYGILTKKGGSSVQAVADDIVRDFYGDLDHDDQADEARDYIINFLLNSTKKEMREFIFNNRLDEARKLAEYAETNQEEEAQEPETPAEEPVVEEPQTEEATEEVTEDLPEEEATPEAPAVEEPEAEPVVETPETETEEEPAEEAEETENKEENAGKSEEKTVTSQEEESAPKKEGESTYGSSNKVVSKARYEELRKKMLEKLKGQMNAGFDPEIFAYGVEMAAYHIEAGARKFIEFAKNIINDLGDAIRPYLKAIYNGARDLPGMEEIKNEMTPASEVEGIDINADFNALSDEQGTDSLRDDAGRDSAPVSGGDEGGVGEEQGDVDLPTDTGTPGEDSEGRGDGDDAGDNSGGEEEGRPEDDSTPSGEADGEVAPGSNGKRGRKANGTRGRGGKRGGTDGRGRGGKRSGDTDRREGGDTESDASGDVAEETGEKENPEDSRETAKAAKEKTVSEETDTEKLESEKDNLKEKLSDLSEGDESAEERAKLAGELEAVIDRLRELYKDAPKKLDSLAQEKVPYVSVSDPNGEYCIGSVVPSGVADAMHEAALRIEREINKPLAEFVREELGYETLEDMFTRDGKDVGLAAEQVDAAALAIYQMKQGRMLINGDMTGIGKGRVGAALIRWAVKNGKKCIFATDKPGLFSDMYRDITDIGSGYKSDKEPGLLPFIINDKDPGNKNKTVTIIDGEKKEKVKSPSKTVKAKVFDGDGSSLPKVGDSIDRERSGPKGGPQIRGKQYDFVMMTYSQAQSARGTFAKNKLEWLKSYAKDAIIICDESHLAAGDSTRGSYFQDMVKSCGGVTFMSATFAKNPECMALYAIRSSMSDARMSNQAFIETVKNYGVPMQEFLAQTLMKSGEMVRRERDFTGVETTWTDPKELYSEEEYNSCRETNDKTVALIRDIIQFQRSFIDPIIRKMNEGYKAVNRASEENGEGWFYSYTNTAYSSQVSNICNLMFYAMKAKKAADVAIEKMKKGEKAIIVVDNTLEGYIKEIEGIVNSPDFTAVFEKGAKNILKYRFNKRWKKLDREASEEKGEPVWVEDEEKAEVEEYETIRPKFESSDELAYQELLQRIKNYSADKTLTRLSISPIDYIKELIQDAGFSCGEITGREVQLVRNEDGTYKKDKRDNERKDTEYRFNGGTADNPLPASEQYDAVILNSAAATGISLHASRRFGNQAKRNMVIVQPAKDQNVEVQVRGRNDRTGQVQRGAYYYITSPIPAEFKTVMMLRKKLASLDAQASGTANVSSNKVDADDMDNKYGDEVARDFLSEHPEINYQLDRPLLPEKDPKSGEMIYKVRPGQLYKLLIGMQRMTCAEQEMILESLQEQYIELVEYYEQNGTNELSSSVLDLEAVTIDEGVFVHGKDNSSISGFAHDTKLERVEVNVLKKPMLSTQIYDTMRKLGVFTEEGKIDPAYGDKVLAASTEYVKQKKDELDAKHAEELDELIKTLKEANPKPDEVTEEEWLEGINKSEAALEMRDRHNREAKTVGENLDIQAGRVEYAKNNLKPGALMMVPLIDGAADSVPYGPGRFIGFKTSKDGNPKSVKAVFATKDSRSQISFPVVKMKDMITGIIHRTNDSGDLYETNLRDIGGWRDDKSITDEDRRKDRDAWWDKRVPKKGRSIRYIITGNLFQAGFNIGTQKKQDKYGYSQKEESVRGKMCLFTRKDPETGRITVEQGMLLVDSFDPETFYVSDVVKKPDVWENGDAIRDKKSNITVFRSGNNLVIQFSKRKSEKMANHPVLKDETIMGMMNEDKFTRKKEYIECTVPDEKVDAALDHLYKEYGFTKDRLFIMPDSTERVDAIVPDTRPYQEIITEMKQKYPYYDYANEVEYELTRLIARYKADIENEDVIAQIKDFVAYRQALYRREYAKEDTGRLAWFALMKQEEFERNTENKAMREKAFNELEAIKVEMAARLGDIANSGTQKHYKQGRHTLKEIEDIFNEFNKDEFNKKMAEKVFKKFKGIKEANIPILFSDRIDNGTGGFSKGQIVEYNWKFFNSEWIPDYLKSNTVLHELTHTLTVYAKYSIDQGYGYLLNDDVRALVNELYSIYRAIRWDAAFRHETYQDYGTKNWEEMLAEAASNETFREDLKKVKLIKTVRDGDASFSKAQDGMDTTGKKVVSAYDAVIERLNDLIDSFNETALIEIYRGSDAGEKYSRIDEGTLYRRGTVENLMNPIDRARAISDVSDLAKKLGVKFKEDSSLNGKGAFDPKTGQIRINIDAHDGTFDLQSTLLHEAVAHYGLRKLLGKDFYSELKTIYDEAAPSIREKIDEIAKKNGLSTSVATEEYLASLAEDGRFDGGEESFWQKVWYAIHQILRKLGFKPHLTDADMRALLYASYRNLQTRGAVAQAHHISVQNALRKQAELSRENANFVDNGNENDRTGTDGVSDGLRGVSDVRGLPSGSSGRLSSNDDFRGVRVLEEGLEVLFREHPDYRDGDAGREGADRGYDSERVRRVAISESIIRTAKENGLFIDYSEFRARRADLLPGHTMESDVYFDAENNRYIKVRDPFVSSRLTSNKDSDILYQHIIHNLYFPSTKYTFLGVTQKPYSDEVRFVLSQESAGHVVKGASAMDMLSWYQKNGFVPGGVDKKYVHWFKKDGISVCDLGGHNLLLNSEGEWKPIDPCIRFDEDPRTIVDDNIPKDSEYISEQFGEGFNDLPEEVRELAIEQDTDELYRRSSQGATAQTAAEMYGNNVRTIGSAVQEVLVDEYHPVDVLMDALASESKSKVKDDERVSDMMRETGGKAMQEIREYDKKFLQPMWTAVGEFRKNTGSSIKDTETYIGLKSGLERNVVLAKRDAKRDYQAEYDAEIDKINQEEKEKKKFLDRQLKNGKISDVTYAGELTVLQQEMKQKRDDAETERQARFADIDTGTDKRYLEYRKKDYSAITAWAEKEDLQEAEQLAADYVADMESRAGASTVKEMWKRINAATKETLKFQYEHQILSRQQYQDISKMMDYYVPMRGFSEDTAEDLFNYYVTAQSNDFQATVLTAKGRKTWYEGPLGNIGAMHSSAIAQGVKNTAKLSLLDAVRRRPENTIATVTRAWFVKNGQKDVNGKDLYDVAYPQIPEGATRAQREAIVEQFEQDMKEAKERGDAYNSHREVDLHGGVVAFEKESHKNEHIVKVREGGKEYGIIINGNPAAAQAINGVKKGLTTEVRFFQGLRKWTRILSSMFTTFSVPFWVSNYQRDFGQGLTNAFIRNKKDYVGRYIKNRWRAFKLFPLIIGDETMDNALAKGDPVAVLYQQYLENGGPMGQNRIGDNEYFERQMKRYLDDSAKRGIIKGANAVLNFIGGVGEAIETITRFATFMTSMEVGRSIHESVSDAKEISTNFARKGSGRSFSRDELDRMTHADGTKLKPIEKGFVNALSIGVELCRASIPFFNAAVQGLENKYTNYTENFGKTLLADSMYLMLGLGMKLLLGGAGGDDDKEKYSHTSDYLRRNNMLTPLGNGRYVKWALPQEYRVMFALGDIIGSAIQKERPIEDLGIDAFGAIAQLSPIGVVTDEVVFNPRNKKEAYQTLLTNAAPGVLAPILESVFNRDFKGARIYNQGFNDDLLAYPGYRKALDTTGKEYVAISKFLNDISGGDDTVPGIIDQMIPNPAIIEHLVESYLSGPYQIVVRVPEAIAKTVKGEVTTRDIPLWNRLFLNTNDNNRDSFYSNMYYYFKEEDTEAKRRHSQYKSRKKEGNVADFYDSKMYKYMLVFKKYEANEKAYRKLEKQYEEKGDMDKKKEYEKKLEETRYKIAKECLDIYFDRNGKEEVK